MVEIGGRNQYWSNVVFDLDEMPPSELCLIQRPNNSKCRPIIKTSK